MATKVGEIEVAVIARLDKLEKDLNTVKKKSQEAEEASKGAMARVSAAASKMGKQLLIAGAAMVTIGGARAMGRAIKSSLDFANTLGNTASKLGVTTDFLQEMRFAAEQSGVGIQTADLALQRFARRSAEAAVGTGEAKGALEQMRIALRDGEGQLRSTEALFSDAMKALGKIDDPAEKLRLAFKLFDSEGAALVNMAEGFKRLQKEAREMGIVLDEAAIVKAQEASGKIDALSMVTQTELNAALIDLAPLLVDAGRGMAWMARQASDSYSSIRKWAVVVGLAKRDLSQLTPEEDFERSAPPIDEAKEKAALELREKFIKATRALELKNAGDLVEIAKWERDQKIIIAREMLDEQVIGWKEYGERVLAVVDEFDAEVIDINENAAEQFVKDWEDSVSDFENNWDGLTDYIGDGFKDAMADMIITGEASFAQLGEAFLREFVQRALSATLDPTFASVFGAIQKIGSNLGFLGGDQISPLSNLQTSDGVPYMIASPEIPFSDFSLPADIAFPGKRSSVGPDRASASVSVNIINASGEKAETSETQNADGTRNIEVMIGKSVSADIYRGGPIDSAIRNSYGLKRPGSHGV